MSMAAIRTRGGGGGGGAAGTCVPQGQPAEYAIVESLLGLHVESGQAGIIRAAADGARSRFTIAIGRPYISHHPHSGEGRARSDDCRWMGPVVPMTSSRSLTIVGNTKKMSIFGRDAPSIR